MFFVFIFSAKMKKGKLYFHCLSELVVVAMPQSHSFSPVLLLLLTDTKYFSLLETKKEKKKKMSAAGRKYKIVLLGDSGVGKSSLAQRLIKDEWTDNISSTVGASFYRYTPQLDAATLKEAGINNNNGISFDIWDTAGQERYKSLASMYYRGAAAALVVYDITSYESYERAKYWMKELNENSPETHVTLCGNKVDMDNNNNNDGGASFRKVPREEGKAFCDANNLFFVEVSAKTGVNVKTAFDNIAIHLLRTDNRNNVRQGGVVGATEREQSGENGKKGGCCN
ncbi:Rab family, other [Angomonas deanei]|nr:Rab family, other [Angomonas deanei]|eukprot:EPY35491.1 Rab family, other [Angomonas deanei]